MKEIPINSSFYNALLALQWGDNKNILLYNIQKTLIKWDLRSDKTLRL